MRPLPLRSTVSARFARLVRCIGPVLLAGLGATACTFTTDFDAPFPATDATDATDATVSEAGPAEDLGGVCGEDCRDTVNCMETIGCAGSSHPDVISRFEGYCRADCASKNPNHYRVGQCRGSVYADLIEEYRDAFEMACNADASLCDAYCFGATDDGGSEPSLFELCFERTGSRLAKNVCVQTCSRFSDAFWRCVGAAQVEEPQAGECVRERECAEAHPPARLLGRD